MCTRGKKQNQSKKTMEEIEYGSSGRGFVWSQKSDQRLVTKKTQNNWRDWLVDEQILALIYLYARQNDHERAHNRMGEVELVQAVYPRPFFIVEDDQETGDRNERHDEH